MVDPARRSLKILHVLRAPVGGLFRHVLDLARGQIARGHQVGLVTDSTTGGGHAEAALAQLVPKLSLGLMRIAMSRQVGPSDVVACGHVARRAADVGADVIHGHGAKGGAYARLARGWNALRVYTPHGGSLHYEWTSPTGFIYLASEREMLPRTDLILFESAFSRDVFRSKIGDPGARARVIHNGVAPAEFEPVETDLKACDLVFVGELRELKGVDVLIKAVGLLARGGRCPTLTIVGDGPDRAAFEQVANRLGPKIAEAVRFVGALPARTGFTFGRLMVVPSRAESLPYIVLEAAAAGLPVIATKVGGIPEIFGPDSDQLVPPSNANALAQAIANSLKDPAGAQERVQRLRARIREHFTVEAMTEAVLAAYHDALGQREGIEAPARRLG